MREHHARTINQVDSLHERNVLPDLGLAGYGRHIAHLLLAQRVYHRALACVRVSDEAYTNLFVVFVQLAKLTQQLNESALAERIRQAGVEGECRMLLR